MYFAKFSRSFQRTHLDSCFYVIKVNNNKTRTKSTISVLIVDFVFLQLWADHQFFSSWAITPLQNLSVIYLNENKCTNLHARQTFNGYFTQKVDVYWLKFLKVNIQREDVLLVGRKADLRTTGEQFVKYQLMGTGYLLISFPVWKTLYSKESPFKGHSTFSWKVYSNRV